MYGALHPIASYLHISLLTLMPLTHQADMVLDCSTPPVLAREGVSQGRESCKGGSLAREEVLQGERSRKGRGLARGGILSLNHIGAQRG